ncbi:MAG: hypothetical protein IH602_01780 [Bryobacteraceae bacterium]|nr:hypothetical protein [Bryobacteraceae bacterium]
MITLFLAVEAKPDSEIVFEGADVVGYYQTLGVTARDEDGLINLVQSHLKSDLGSTLLEIAERWEPDFDGTDSDVRDLVGQMDEVGIWYSSGRAWFGPEETDEEAGTTGVV